MLRSEIKQIIINKTNKAVNFDTLTVLLGIEQQNNYKDFSNSDIKFINNIMLVGKLAIIKSKVERVNVKLIFDKEMKIRRLSGTEM